MSNARNLARLLPSATGQLPDAAMASGSVIQVVRASSGTGSIENSSASFVTAATLNITPLSASSILIATFSGAYYKQNTAVSDPGSGRYRFTLNGTVTGDEFYSYYNESPSNFTIVPLSRSISIAPNSTSQQTVAFQFRSTNGGSSQLLYPRAELIVMEIAP